MRLTRSTRTIMQVPIAQLDRASASEAEGCRVDSCWGRSTRRSWHCGAFFNLCSFAPGNVGSRTRRRADARASFDLKRVLSSVFLDIRPVASAKTVRSTLRRRRLGQSLFGCAASISRRSRLWSVSFRRRPFGGSIFLNRICFVTGGSLSLGSCLRFFKHIPKEICNGRS